VEASLARAAGARPRSHQQAPTRGTGFKSAGQNPLAEGRATLIRRLRNAGSRQAPGRKVDGVVPEVEGRFFFLFLRLRRPKKDGGQSETISRPRVRGYRSAAPDRQRWGCGGTITGSGVNQRASTRKMDLRGRRRRIRNRVVCATDGLVGAGMDDTART